MEADCLVLAQLGLIIMEADCIALAYIVGVVNCEERSYCVKLSCADS